MIPILQGGGDRGNGWVCMQCVVPEACRPREEDSHYKNKDFHYWGSGIQSPKWAGFEENRRG